MRSERLRKSVPGVAILAWLLVSISNLSISWAEDDAKAKNESCAAGDEESTPSMTHIEYSPLGGLVKIEVPRIPMPGDRSETAKKRDIVSGSILWPVFGFQVYHQGDYYVAGGGAIEVPFMKVLDTDSLLSRLEKGPSPEEDPFRHQFDQPLIAGYSFVLAGKMEGERKSGEKPKWEIQRVRYLDSLVLCAYERAEWGPDSYRWEWLNIPALTPLARGHTPKTSSWRVLETPFTTVFTHERIGGKRETRLLDLLVASLYESSAHEGKKPSAKWAYLKTWVGTVAASSRKADSRSLDVLKTPRVLGEWSEFALYRDREKTDGIRSRQILRLPLLGPVWSTWRESDQAEAHWGVLPRLFVRTAPQEAR